MVLTAAPALSLGTDGAALFAGPAHACLPDLLAAIAALPSDRAGIRLHGVAPLRHLLATDGPIGALARSLIGSAARPVRLLLFDKTATTNWSLGWHQDRTICVAERREVDGFGPWSTKQGLCHVAPPFAILAGMATLRIHLDAVPETNAPLLIAPGSHRFGFVAEPEIGS